MLVLSLLAACSDARDESARLGTLALPMGVEIANVRYRLVHAVFDVDGPEDAVLNADSLPEDGSLTVQLPEGNYVVSLRPGWELQRATRSGWEPVAAQLVGSASQTVTIKRFETTLVRFQFETAHGMVDMTPGKLSIEIDVVERAGVTNAAQVATNDAETCVLTKEGEVRCQDVRIDVGGRATAIALGDAHACAILEGGRLRCWGNGGDGRLGYGNTNTISDDAALRAAGDVEVGGFVVQVATGSQHTCALLDGGAVRCWGLGVTGALGYGNRNAIGDDELPRNAGDVPVGEVVTQIAAGGVNTCALLASGGLRCWGFSDLVGQSYGDDEPASDAPERTFDARVKQVAMGVAHHCSLLVNNSVVCQGFSSARYLPTTDHLTGGVLGEGMVEVAAGFLHNCARFADGAVRCWGYNVQGQLGVPSTTVGTSVPASRAVTVPGFSRPIDLGLGKNRSCVVLADGSVRCWPATPVAPGMP